MVAEHGVHRHHLGVHIPYPDKAVPLDAVPKIFLHTQMNRVGSGLPDLVQPLVAAAELPDVRDVTVAGDCPDRYQQCLRVLTEQVQTHKAEAGVAIFNGPEPRD